LRRAAQEQLHDCLGEAARDCEVRAENDGKLGVQGTVGSLEEKLAVSRRLRQVDGCRSVDNRLSVTMLAREGRRLTPVTADGALAVEESSPAPLIARAKGDDESRTDRALTTAPAPPVPLGDRTAAGKDAPVDLSSVPPTPSSWADPAGATKAKAARPKPKTDATTFAAVPSGVPAASTASKAADPVRAKAAGAGQVVPPPPARIQKSSTSSFASTPAPAAKAASTPAPAAAPFAKVASPKKTDLDVLAVQGVSSRTMVDAPRKTAAPTTPAPNKPKVLELSEKPTPPRPLPPAPEALAAHAQKPPAPQVIRPVAAAAPAAEAPPVKASAIMLTGKQNWKLGYASPPPPGGGGVWPAPFAVRPPAASVTSGTILFEEDEPAARPPVATTAFSVARAEKTPPKPPTPTRLEALKYPAAPPQAPKQPAAPPQAAKPPAPPQAAKTDRPAPRQVVPFTAEQMRKRVEALCKDQASSVQVQDLPDGRMKVLIKVATPDQQRAVSERVMRLPEMTGSNVHLEMVVESR
jgi:hypothetical protein